MTTDRTLSFVSSELSGLVQMLGSVSLLADMLGMSAENAGRAGIIGDRQQTLYNYRYNTKCALFVISFRSFIQIPHTKYLTN